MSTSTGTTVQSEFAKRQLERMGWKEGSGLGKDRQGRAAPIIVKQRSDVTGGLGIEKEKVRQVQHTIQNEWWKDAIGDTLSKLCDKKDKKKRKRGTDKTNSEETAKKKKVFTDEELFVATGGARFGMRAGKTRNQAKWRRTEAADTVAVVQQNGNKDDEVSDSATSSAPRMETQSIRTVECANDEAQTSKCDDSLKKKRKSKKSQLDKKSGSMKKKKKDKLNNAVVIEQQQGKELSNPDDCTVAKPSQEEKRKKKKK